MRKERKLPMWAQKLLDSHKGAARPSAKDPMPAWLKEEIQRKPLWYFIRGTEKPRTNHPYYLIEDVRKQPALWHEALKLEGRIAEIANKIVRDGIEKIVFTGCGSAFFTSILGRVLTENLANIEAEAWESLEFANYYPFLKGKTMLIAQSATGGSMETLAAVKRAHEKHLYVLGIVNTPGSPLEDEVDEAIVFPVTQKCGPDISVITTRMILLYLLALKLAGRAPSDVSFLEHEVKESPSLAEVFLQKQESYIDELAGIYHTAKGFFLVGGGANYFSAIEGALKIEEESSLPCKAYRTSEYPHDAMALLSKNYPTIPIILHGPSYDRMTQIARTARAAESPVLAVITDNMDDVNEYADHSIKIPDVDEMVAPLFVTIFFQIFGYYIGVKNGVNPDTLKTDVLKNATAWLTAFPLGSH